MQRKTPEFASQLQEQADRALRHFCYEGDLKWVSLLLWAGADPRSSGPTLDDDEDLDGSEHTTAIAAAAYTPNPQILKRLKPDPATDDVGKLLSHAAAFGRVESVRYLLELGANPNDKPNVGSSALDKCLSTSLSCESFGYRIRFSWYNTDAKASRYSVSETLDTFGLLLEHGALFRPDNNRDVASIRRSLCECEPDVTLKVVEGLIKRSACTPDTVQNLLRTPAMKKHLLELSRRLKLLGFDVRTAEQKKEDEQKEGNSRTWALRELASRYDREQLYTEIWLEPIQHVAKKYDISDVGLAKVCRRLNIPRPGRGYWAMKAAGKPLLRQLPLPKLLL